MDIPLAVALHKTYTTERQRSGCWEACFANTLHIDVLPPLRIFHALNFYSVIHLE
ncbi:MAG: hypothetical protein NZ551_12215 [Microscillaceae bacterium]|nr:hypothetical protein [Microscillaceae bacterium]MDW8461960.1 hypothetical protein [Cytophagales bacterium]